MSPESTATRAKAETPQEARNSYRAVLVFPILILLGAIVGYFFAGPVSEGAFLVNPLLGIIMFTMGLTLQPVDFALVVKRPLPVILVVIAQYVIMPLAAVLVCWILQLPGEIAAGVILLGCAPGGTASNVVAYLARGDVALSVAMTSVSTILAPLATPLLTLWLAGQYLPVDAAGMAMSIVQIVLLPVIGGLVVRLLLPKLVKQALPVLPWLSVLTISAVVAFVVSGSADRVIEAGLLVFAAVVLHNGLGLVLGYGVGIALKQPLSIRRTMAVEIGMQNSGLAAGLAATYMNPLAALPGAVFSLWQNMSGALFAAWCRRRDRALLQQEEDATAPSA
ncbi:bile acid:sodium symporter family protein [Sediminivirga luteola]|uniref:Na+-dependent transporter n=1 Tax=Sediminivirga luteola TaxID=1774748 RepID=A0A8J2TXZ1_9MICO|nr:bile acid:sodium symporter family protein [Sediminivirga luteola]MCI2265815.1 bile acid:sodium symporter family protein [Sediminivirga luteola]GGA14416.1 Na+-dependent transporter [Sediminivirga luteola]